MKIDKGIFYNYLIIECFIFIYKKKLRISLIFCKVCIVESFVIILNVYFVYVCI